MADEDQPTRMFEPDPGVTAPDRQIAEALQSIAVSLCWIEHHLKTLRAEPRPVI